MNLAVSNVNANCRFGYFSDAPPEPFFEPSLISPNRTMRTDRVRMICRAIEAAARIGSPCVSITSGKALPTVPPTRALELLREGLKPVLQAAETHGINVGIECEPGLLIEWTDELRELIDRMGSARLGANRHEGYGGWTARRFATHFTGVARRGDYRKRGSPFLYKNADGEPVPRKAFRLGDKVMQLRNNYELDVYNGDVGVVTLVDEDAKEMQVQFDDRVVLYGFDDLDDLTLAYAATVHKSQGSEYPAVVLALMPQHYLLLQRNMLYTAITRGEKLVVIVGDRDHDEVLALAGRARGPCHIIASIDEARAVPLNDKTLVVAQTTFNQSLFREIVEVLRARKPDLEVVDRRIKRLEKDVTRPTPHQKEDRLELECQKRIRKALEEGAGVAAVDFSEAEEKALRGFRFLSAKPMLVLLNRGEESVGREPAWREEDFGCPVVWMFAKLELELEELGDEVFVGA